MKKTYIYILFSIMVISQIAVAAQIVYQYETTIASANVYKFKTAPVDPNDPFRGKYIVLNFEMNAFNTEDNDWDYGETAYLYISKNENGYARIDTLSTNLLKNNSNDYVEVTLGSYYNGKIHFDLPFDRYYMEESKAMDAEILYRDSQQRDAAQDVYAVVHIQQGISVLTDVVINGMSIKDAVEK